jgi:hypothetical protein
MADKNAILRQIEAHAATGSNVFYVYDKTGQLVMPVSHRTAAEQAIRNHY